MISIVVVFDDEKKFNRILLDSLNKQTVEFELISIDNTQGEIKSIVEAYNVKGRQAKGKYIIFIRPDLELDNDHWLENAEKSLDTVLDLGIAGIAGMAGSGVDDRRRGRGSFSRGGTTWEYSNAVDIPTSVQTLDECLLIIPRDVFERNQFDASTFKADSCFGIDYCLSVQRSGLGVYVIPFSVYHRCKHIVINSLLDSQVKLFNKNRRLYPHIYTTTGELSWGSLQKRRLFNFLRPLYDLLFPAWTQYLRREIRPDDRVLDLGCGYNSPLQFCQTSYTTGVDNFAPYLEESEKKGLHSEYVKADLREVEFPPSSYDIVMASEVLEHLSKEDGYKLIAKMEQWARKKVILTTPNNFIPQDVFDDNPLQEHLSGWQAMDFKKIGFKVQGMNGGKRLRDEKGEIKNRPFFFWQQVSAVSQWFVYWCPEQAFQLFAVKNVRTGRR